MTTGLWPPGGRDPRWQAGALSPAGLRVLVSERRDALALLGRARWPALVTLCAAMTVAAVIPGLSALMSGQIVRAVSHHGGASTEAALPYIAGFAALVLVEQLALVARDAGREVVVAGIDGSVRSAVRRMACSPARIDVVETASFADDAARATQPSALFGRTPGYAATGQLILFQRLASLVLPLVILARFSAWFAIAVLAGAILLRTLGRRQFIALTRYAEIQLGMQRRSDYVEGLALDPGSARELRLFGWTDWLVGQWRDSAKGRIDDFSLAHRSVLRRQVLNAALAAGLGLMVTLAPGLQLLREPGAAGEIVQVVAAALVVMQYSLMGFESFDMDYGMAGARALERLGAGHQASRADRLAPSPDVRAGGPPDLRCEDLSFAYPGGRLVLDGLSMRIAPGEVLAIVGSNGAGKTTLIKLLAGLYEPSGGLITASGRPAGSFSPDAWRRSLAVVYQDFVRYPATVRDNVTLGAPEAVPDDAEVLTTLERAGLAEFVGRLPMGLDTPLWQASGGSTDMSGGQWQRLALARALFAVGHGRRILILDEPTAQLDVTAEAAFYDQVIATVTGASVIIISHRLSTVRHADRIVLLRDGRITESGSHAQLMAADGEYAALFELQAARFRAPAADGSA